MNCPYCEETSLEALAHQNSKKYFECLNCGLVFLDPQAHLVSDKERERYLQHNNSMDDPNYHQFLGRLLDPMRAYVKASMRGLDFGCGPVPVLARLFEERSLDVRVYDPFFFRSDELLAPSQYDFVTSSEVVEHFNRPRESWALLTSLLKPDGILGVMTSTFARSKNWKEQFHAWYYPNDPTHVCFYSDEFFGVLAKDFSLELIESPHTNVRIFKKRA